MPSGTRRSSCALGDFRLPRQPRDLYRDRGFHYATFCRGGDSHLASRAGAVPPYMRAVFPSDLCNFAIPEVSLFGSEFGADEVIPAELVIC